MKTFAASVGLLALGTSVLNAVENKVLNAQQSTKPWSVSASLRGFYDSNINSSPDGSVQESAGFEVSPKLNYGIAGERTSLNLGYYLSAKWYANPYSTPTYSWDSPWELTQTMEAALSHTFSPRIDVNLVDSFVIGQEPDVLQVPNTPFATSQSLNGDNIRNYAAINMNLQATSLLGFQVGYANSLYNYDDSGPGSNSALLDRMENAVNIDSRWTLQPQTIGILGYKFSQVGYTGDEFLGTPTFFSPIPPKSDSRNSRGSTFYVGAEHAFTPDISGNLNVGAQINDFYNDPDASTKTTPYVQGSMNYRYRATSSLQAGVSLMQSPTDTYDPQGQSYVLNATSLVLYGAWVHEILPRLYSNVNGSFQQSKFNGGGVDGDSTLYYRLGLNLAYEITKHLSASVGYNWDQSDAPDAISYQSYNRSRVYIGVTAAY